MQRRLLRSFPALLAVTLVAAQAPSAWAIPNASTERAPVTASAPRATTNPQLQAARASEPRASELSEERRRQLAEREQENGAMEDYKGGLVIEVGAGVIILALILIIVFVD
jgi:hypothetical protein